MNKLQKEKADKKTKDNQKKQNETIYLLPLSSFFCRQTVNDLFLLPKPLNQLICPSWHLLIIDISKLRRCNRRPCKPFTSEWLEYAIKVCCSAHARANHFTIRTHKIFRKVFSESNQLNFFICFRSLILVTIPAELQLKVIQQKIRNNTRLLKLKKVVQKLKNKNNTEMVQSRKPFKKCSQTLMINLFTYHDT